MGISVVLIVAIYMIFFMPSKKEDYTGLKTTTGESLLAQQADNQDIFTLVQHDTDNDGIPDWEESLWGTDKTKKATFEGMPDATYIENKKKELKTDKINTENTLTETDRFAREFFTAYTAMKESGKVDPNAINEFSNELGKNIVSPDIIDQYNASDIKTTSKDTSVERTQYYIVIKNIFDSYQKAGIGEELSILGGRLATYSSTGKASSYEKLPAIATAYKNFAEKVMEHAVPASLAEIHLRIANSANNTGTSVQNMTKTITDPIVGLSGLSQYQKYSDELVKNVADLKAVLSKK